MMKTNMNKLVMVTNEGGMWSHSWALTPHIEPGPREGWLRVSKVTGPGPVKILPKGQVESNLGLCLKLQVVLSEQVCFVWNGLHEDSYLQWWFWWKFKQCRTLPSIFSLIIKIWNSLDCGVDHSASTKRLHSSQVMMWCSDILIQWYCEKCYKNTVVNLYSDRGYCDTAIQEYFCRV